MPYLKLLLLAIAFAYVFGAESERTSRWSMFSLFNLIRFTNEECETTSGRRGTCYLPDECSAISGGKASGPCARGYGVCCLVERSCNGSTGGKNSTYFANVGYPQVPPSNYSLLSSCRFVVEPKGNICQVRLDLEALDLSSGFRNPDGTCNGSSLTVDWERPQKHNRGLPIHLCSGYQYNYQHLYVDMEGATGPLVLNLQNPDRSRWSIKVTQISCSSKHLAPQGCLQYYQDLGGELSRLDPSRRYSACFRRQSGFCTLVFRPTVGLREQEAELKVLDLNADRQNEVEDSTKVHASTYEPTKLSSPVYETTKAFSPVPDRQVSANTTTYVPPTELKTETVTAGGATDLASTQKPADTTSFVTVTVEPYFHTAESNDHPVTETCKWDDHSGVVQIADSGLYCKHHMNDYYNRITVPYTSPWIVFFGVDSSPSQTENGNWLIFEQMDCAVEVQDV